jgi:hypothetical protein
VEERDTLALHVGLEVIGAAMAIVPLIATFRAWRRTGSIKLAMAFAAFTILEVRFIIMILIHTVLVVPHVYEELLDFVGDLLVIAAFAGAFLYGTRWSAVREPVGNA